MKTLVCNLKRSFFSSNTKSILTAKECISINPPMKMHNNSFYFIIIFVTKNCLIFWSKIMSHDILYFIATNKDRRKFSWPFTLSSAVSKPDERTPAGDHQFSGPTIVFVVIYSLAHHVLVSQRQKGVYFYKAYLNSYYNTSTSTVD